MKYLAVVIGTSAGGFEALKKLLPMLVEDFKMPLVVVQHMHSESGGSVPHMLGEMCRVRVKQADEKEPLMPATVYFAPPDYHLLIDDDATLALSADEAVNYARPSIDVLFESAAEVFRQRLIGVILTGANSDGALGLKKIKDMGGLTIVQEPSDAAVDAMPRAAIAAARPHRVLTIEDIGRILNILSVRFS
jgi:two-component system chemotaxis response regulator CheB